MGSAALQYPNSIPAQTRLMESPLCTEASRELLISKPNNSQSAQKQVCSSTPPCKHQFVCFSITAGLEVPTQRKGAINLTQPDMWPSRPWLKTLLWRCHEPARRGRGWRRKPKWPDTFHNLVWLAKQIWGCVVNMKNTDTAEINKDLPKPKPLLFHEIIVREIISSSGVSVCKSCNETWLRQLQKAIQLNNAINMASIGAPEWLILFWRGSCTQIKWRILRVNTEHSTNVAHQQLQHKTVCIGPKLQHFRQLHLQPQKV